MARKNIRKGRPIKQSELEVIWEQVPNPDPTAWQRAVAMLFRLTPPNKPDDREDDSKSGKQLPLF